MDFEILHYPNSSNSDISDDEFYNVKQGEYTRFDSFDDDIEIIKSNVSLNQSDNSGEYFQYDSIDDIVIVHPKPQINKFANSKADEIDVNQNISSELASKYDAVIQEIKDEQILNTIKTEKIMTNTLTNFKTNKFEFTSTNNEIVKQIKVEQISNITETEKEMTNNLVNFKTVVPYVSQNISSDLVSKYDEIVKEIKREQISNITETEKEMTNNLVNFKTNDVSQNISPEFLFKYDETVKEIREQISNITETQKEMINNLANFKTDEPDVSQNISLGFVSKQDEIVKEIKGEQISNITETQKEMTNNLANFKTNEADITQNISPGLASKHDEVVQEINDIQVSNTTKPEKLSPLEGFRKRLQTRISNDFSKLKRPSFLNKLKNEKYSDIFKRKSKSLFRTSSVPKIFIFSPKGTGHDTSDSGNDSDSSDDVNIFKKQLDRLEKWSSNQKLSVSSNKKAIRKSI